MAEGVHYGVLVVVEVERVFLLGSALLQVQSGLVQGALDSVMTGLFGVLRVPDGLLTFQLGQYGLIVLVLVGGVGVLAFFISRGCGEAAGGFLPNASQLLVIPGSLTNTIGK